MQRVVDDLVRADVIPHILTRPARDRIELHQTKLGIIFNLLRVRPGRGLISSYACDPSLVLRQNPGQRLYLADVAAFVRADAP